MASGGSPSIDLVYVLLKIFSAIVLGYVCRSTGLVSPENGDTKALNLFVGRIAFPLLIFNTIATANLSSIDLGVVLACSCAKLVVFICAWTLGFLVYMRTARHGQLGQRILTATVFGYLTIASDDFATGFPVIWALYGASMTVYIAANALACYFVMVPLTLVLFEAGQSLRNSELGDESPQTRSHRLRGACLNVMRNPVIAMTALGLVFQLLVGQWCLEKDPKKGGVMRFREPLGGVIEYWTGPFAMLALFSTGLSLRSASVHFWPMILVSFKLLVCAFLSYAFGMLFVRLEPCHLLQDFNFFYGSIPSSSAPLIFAMQFDPPTVELVAAAILVGYVMAGPNMFVMSMFLSKESADMTATLQAVQAATGLAGSFFAALALLFYLFTYSSWAWSGQVLGAYVLAALFYSVLGSHVTSNCTKTPPEPPSHLQLFLLLSSERLCTYLVLFMQVLQIRGWRPLRRLHLVSLIGAALVLSLGLSMFVPPLGMPRICGEGHSLLSGFMSGLLLLLATLALAGWNLVCRRRRGGSLECEDTGRHPVGIAKTLCTVQGLRALIQVVNCAALVLNGERGVHGELVQMLIMEQVLGQGQAIFCFLAMLLQELSSDRLRNSCECFAQVPRCTDDSDADVDMLSALPFQRNTSIIQRTASGERSEPLSFAPLS